MAKRMNSVVRLMPAARATSASVAVGDAASTRVAVSRIASVDTVMRQR